jgi:hypothetical protein
MSEKLEYFKFEVVPENLGVTYAPNNNYYRVPLFHVEVAYGGKRYGFNCMLPSDERLLTESYLEHFIRMAVGEFRKAIAKEADDKAREDLDSKQAAFVKAADNYRSR